MSVVITEINPVTGVTMASKIICDMCKNELEQGHRSMRDIKVEGTDWLIRVWPIKERGPGNRVIMDICDSCLGALIGGSVTSINGPHEEAAGAK